MKIALYIEDGLEQVVLTPESETEKGILGKMHDGSRDLGIKRGSFYGCRGGWTRHSQQYPDIYGGATERDDDSTIVVLTPAKPVQPPADLASAAIRAKLAVQAQEDRFYGDATQSAEVARMFKLELADAAHDAVLQGRDPT